MRSTVRSSQYLGPRDFARATAAFHALGFSGPRADVPDGTGAYVANIEPQYAADLTPAGVRAIVNWSRSYPLAYFASIADGEYTVAEIVGQYGE